MSHGQVIGKRLPEHAVCYFVELPTRLGVEVVHAKAVNFESGVAVFSNGDLMNRSLVTAYAIGAWESVMQEPKCPYCEEDE